MSPERKVVAIKFLEKIEEFMFKSTTSQPRSENKI